ncbi:MAG: hypothetical protein MTP17_01205 [Candidatus Midichloria sp.]|nr:MAG: hypothetical protein MTP17_01205 [Candidatus Midichloria sp.]
MQYEDGALTKAVADTTISDTALILCSSGKLVVMMINHVVNQPSLFYTSPFINGLYIKSKIHSSIPFIRYLMLNVIIFNQLRILSVP